jgi:hypothetical protein
MGQVERNECRLGLEDRVGEDEVRRFRVTLVLSASSEVCWNRYPYVDLLESASLVRYDQT